MPWWHQIYSKGEKSLYWYLLPSQLLLGMHKIYAIYLSSDMVGEHWKRKTMNGINKWSLSSKCCHRASSSNIKEGGWKLIFHGPVPVVICAWLSLVLNVAVVINKVAK